MSRFAFATLSAALSLGLLAAAGLAQAPAKKTAPAKAAAKAGVMSAAAPAGPATVEQAAKLLDLRTFPRIHGAKLGSLHTLGMLNYDARTTPKAAFEFQRKELARLGFKELPGGYASDDTQSGHFTKDGFVVAVTASPS